LPSRIPTSSSKYPDFKSPVTKVSIRPSGFKSLKPREPVRIIPLHPAETAQFSVSRPATNAFYDPSPTPDEIVHVWDEGSKRPKTQNEKSRTKSRTQAFSFESHDFFSSKPPENQSEIPIIVNKNDKNRRIASAKRNIGSRAGQRPSTFKPARSSFATSLDHEFLELFQM
jgi:hypothetical protein